MKYLKKKFLKWKGDCKIKMVYKDSSEKDEEEMKAVGGFVLEFERRYKIERELTLEMIKMCRERNIEGIINAHKKAYEHSFKIYKELCEPTKEKIEKLQKPYSNPDLIELAKNMIKLHKKSFMEYDGRVEEIMKDLGVLEEIKELDKRGYNQKELWGVLKEIEKRKRKRDEQD